MPAEDAANGRQMHALLGAETSVGYVVAVAVDDPDGVAWTPVAALPGC